MFDELNPCNICGSKAERYEHRYKSKDGPNYRTLCSNNGCPQWTSPDFCYTQEEGDRNWNKDNPVNHAVKWILIKTTTPTILRNIGGTWTVLTCNDCEQGTSVKGSTHKFDDILQIQHLPTCDKIIEARLSLKTKGENDATK